MVVEKFLRLPEGLAKFRRQELSLAVVDIAICKSSSSQCFEVEKVVECDKVWNSSVLAFAIESFDKVFMHSFNKRSLGPPRIRAGLFA